MYPISRLQSILFFNSHSIDATDYTHHTARMVNDTPLGDPLENSFMAIVVVDKVPNLCLFAKRDIETGEELRYDYGDPKAPWRKNVRICGTRML